MTFSQRHLQEAREIIDAIDVAPIERMVSILVQLRETGGGELASLWAVRLAMSCAGKLDHASAIERQGVNRAGPRTSGAFENDFRDRRLGPQQGSDHEVRCEKSNGSHVAETNEPPGKLRA